MGHPWVVSGPLVVRFWVALLNVFVFIVVALILGLWVCEWVHYQGP